MHAEDVLAAVVPAADAPPGTIVGIDRGGAVSLAAVGMPPDAPVRISSNTKPIVAALALRLISDGVLGLDEPVERHVPELGERRVLRRLDGHDTVPARRPLTVEDLLTMRMGLGFAFEGACPTLDEVGSELGLGPPDPAGLPGPDAWVARLARVPLLDQPGTAWRYDLAYALLGVVLARAGGRPLPELLGAHVLRPLGMADTAFCSSALDVAWARTDDGALAPWDGAGTASRWARPPAFPDARGGLVSTVTDLLRFARALLDGGRGVLSPAAVAAMTTDHLSAGQRAAVSAAPLLDGGGWGYGVGIHPVTPAGPRYGWGGGLGTLWWSWPAHDCAAVLVHPVMPPSAPLCDGFTAAVAARLV